MSNAEAQVSSDHARLATLLWLEPTRAVEVRRPPLPRLDDSSLRAAASCAGDHRALRSAKILLEQARHVAEGSAAALSVVEARFASGLASATDLLEVENVDSAARATAIAAEGGMALATIRLLAATGKIESLL